MPGWLPLQCTAIRDHGVNAGKLGRSAEKEAEQVKVGTGEGSMGMGPGEVCRCRCIVYVKRGQKNILYVGAGMVRMNR